MKDVAVEDGRADGGRLVENPVHCASPAPCASACGLAVRYCAQAKGKVERPVWYRALGAALP